MEKYLEQLLADIAYATENVETPYGEGPFDWWEVKSDEEEERTAPRRPLEEWTGISQAQLPPDELLTDEQVGRLFKALEKMLMAYNWSFVMQIAVPDRIQYRTIRANFAQEAVIKQWNYGYFELCKPGTLHEDCIMGEYCQCKFYTEFFSRWEDEEELSPEEERLRMLEIEISYLKKKHGDRWMRYYPYHLDPAYDDEDGNPYDYGFGSDYEDEEDDEDGWWRR